MTGIRAAKRKESASAKESKQFARRAVAFTRGDSKKKVGITPVAARVFRGLSEAVPAFVGTLLGGRRKVTDDPDTIEPHVSPH